MNIDRIGRRRSARTTEQEKTNTPHEILTKSLIDRLIVPIVAIAFLIPVFSVVAQTTTGVFSSEDEQYLMQIAEPHVLGSTTRSGVAQTTTQPTRRELLLMEPRMAADKSSSASQAANVYVYDYASDEVIHLIVDLNSRRVASQERVQNMQLPLTAAEVKRAIDIAFVDDANGQAIREEFRQITGRNLESVEQIQYKAFVFLASSVSEAKQVNTRECGLRRCARLLLYTADNIALDLSPIIDLSNERVLQIADNPQEGG